MSTALSPLLAPMLSSAAMRAICDDAARLQRMLDFEAALARAEAAVGVIPRSRRGRDRARPATPTRYDIAALAEAATRSGNLAIPLVKALTADVAKRDAEAAGYVHWGATSQDVIDTATDARAARRASTRWSPTSTARSQGFTTLARAPSPHAVGRAHLAAARAADAVRAQARRLCRGAGTLARAAAAAAPRGAGAAIRRRRRHARRARRQRAWRSPSGLRAMLDLPLPDAPWHTHRDRIAEVAAVLRASSPAPAARSRATCR